ncbi:hypothetical protein J2Y55_004408 [Bosea sp. BE125]|uniref:hypothetical protein n=1 Tax=Bosea sp. BE125 TaxID=2817909 RepID=UPI0028602FEC|nr:hypothetical protein [Bosea sp. BE125]MDR6873384.1 hypothetical protein [Bosea sp. BE125]
MDLIVMKKNGFGTPIWNISANVGLASPNQADDVQLVQFGYYATLINPNTKLTAEQQDLYSKIVLGQPCNGTASDPLVAAIRAHQKVRGGPQDGHVSPIKGGTSYDGGKHTFMMLALNNNMSDVAPDVFPRIDKHPKCPPLVAAFVKRACKL